MEVKDSAEEIAEAANALETDIANDVNEMSSRGLRPSSADPPRACEGGAGFCAEVVVSFLQRAAGHKEQRKARKSQRND